MDKFKKGDRVEIMDEVICSKDHRLRGVVEDAMNMMYGSQFPVHSNKMAYKVKVKDSGYVVAYWLTEERLRLVG